MGRVVDQRDARVQVRSSLDVSLHVVQEVRKAFDMLAFISKGIECNGWHVVLQLCKSLRGGQKAVYQNSRGINRVKAVFFVVFFWSQGWGIKY